MRFPTGTNASTDCVSDLFLGCSFFGLRYINRSGQFNTKKLSSTLYAQDNWLIPIQIRTIELLRFRSAGQGRKGVRRAVYFSLPPPFR